MNVDRTKLRIRGMRMQTVASRICAAEWQFGISHERSKRKGTENKGVNPAVARGWGLYTIPVSHGPTPDVTHTAGWTTGPQASETTGKCFEKQGAHSQT